MHKHRSWRRALAVVALILVAGIVFGWAVTALWNWLMPAVFGLGRITFWQALGLFVLGRILFGGLHGIHSHREHRWRMHERWQQMTPEQRESFSRGLRHGCRWHSPHPGGETPGAGDRSP